MQKVFSHASSVIVWLGKTKPSVTTARKLILHYNNPLPTDGQKECERRRPILSYPEKALIALRKLFARPWWTRIWIVQEVVAARELVFFYGDVIIPWKFLRAISEAIQLAEFSKHSNAEILRTCAYRNFTALDNFRRHGSMPFLRLLQGTRNYDASDPRDKLYALLGMASDIPPGDLAPDYSQPVEAVFQNLVGYMATSLGSLDIISSGRLAIAAPGRPTWLPDWRVPDSQLRPLIGEENADHPYRACGETIATGSIAPNWAVLAVEGVVVDQVDCMGGTLKLAQESLSTVRRWHYIAQQNLEPETVATSFPSTIIAEKDNLGKFASPEFTNGFERFVEAGESSETDPTAKFYADAVTRAIMGRQFFVTKRGRMGLGPAGIQLGDNIVVLKGCSVPLIMRDVDAGDEDDGATHYVVLVGEAYVSGIMRGELMKDVERGKYHIETVWLK